MDDASPWYRKAFVVLSHLYGVESEETLDCYASLKKVEVFMTSGLDKIPIAQLAEHIEQLEEQEDTDDEYTDDGDETTDEDECQ